MLNRTIQTMAAVTPQIAAITIHELTVIVRLPVWLSAWQHRLNSDLGPAIGFTTRHCLESIVNRTWSSYQFERLRGNSKHSPPIPVSCAVFPWERRTTADHGLLASRKRNEDKNPAEKPPMQAKP